MVLPLLWLGARAYGGYTHGKEQRRQTNVAEARQRQADLQQQTSWNMQQAEYTRQQQARADAERYLQQLLGVPGSQPGLSAQQPRSPRDLMFRGEGDTPTPLPFNPQAGATVQPLGEFSPAGMKAEMGDLLTDSLQGVPAARPTMPAPTPQPTGQGIGPMTGKPATYEEALAKLPALGASPEAMSLLIPRLQALYAPELATKDYITLPDGRKVPPSQVAYEFKMHPEWEPTDPRIAANFDTAKRFVNGLGTPSPAPSLNPMDIDPMAPKGTQTVELPSPSFDGLTREGYVNSLAGSNLSPEQAALAGDIVEPLLREQGALDKITTAADAKKAEPERLYLYRFNPDTQEIEEYDAGEYVPPTTARSRRDASQRVANNNRDTWLKEHGTLTEQKGNLTDAQIALMKARGQNILWNQGFQQKKLDLQKQYQTAQINLRKLGLKQQADRMTASEKRWKATFQQRAQQFDARLGQDAAKFNASMANKADTEAWNRYIDTRNLARNDAGAMKAYLDSSGNLYNKLLTTFYSTDGKFQPGGGRTEDEVQKQLTELQTSIADVLPDYENRMAELEGQSTYKEYFPSGGGEVPPFNPTGQPYTITPPAPTFGVAPAPAPVPSIGAPQPAPAASNAVKGWNYPPPGRDGADGKGAWPPKSDTAGTVNIQAYFDKLKKTHPGGEVLTTARTYADAYKQKYPTNTVAQMYRDLQATLRTIYGE